MDGPWLSDLESWTYVGDILPRNSRPEGIYFRPKVIFNRKTNKYVLWINHLAPASTPLVSYPDARFLVATSDTSIGPFEIVNEKADIEIEGGGDFDLLVDPNDPESSAYLAYDAWGNNHAVVVEKLSEDYTNSLGSNGSSGQIRNVLFDFHNLF